LDGWIGILPGVDGNAGKKANTQANYYGRRGFIGCHCTYINAVRGAELRDRV
jgi:hypothetical protein